MKKIFVLLLLFSLACKAQVNNVGFYGNSITAGYLVPSGTDYVSDCMRILGGTHYTGCKWAQNGYQTGQMLANYSTEIDVTCFSSPGSYAANVFVPYEYINSIIAGEGAPQVYAEMKALCLAEKAEGRKVVIPTMIASPANPSTEPTRTQLNDSIINHWHQFADTIARIDSIVGMTYVDGLHPDSAGHFLMGRNIAYAISGYFYPSVPATLVRSIKALHSNLILIVLVALGGCGLFEFGRALKEYEKEEERAKKESDMLL